MLLLGLHPLKSREGTGGNTDRPGPYWGLRSARVVSPRVWRAVEPLTGSLLGSELGPVVHGSLPKNPSLCRPPLDEPTTSSLDVWVLDHRRYS